MDFRYTPEEETFRQEFRAWLEPNLQAHRAQWGEDEDEFTQHPSSPASLAWHKRLYDGGWVGLHWPTEYGGRGATQMQQVIYTEESMRLGAPPEVNGMGINMVGPMLMHYGTAEQRARHLRKILSAEDIWCQGFSEPGSGSDLASLSTRAVEDGDARGGRRHLRATAGCRRLAETSERAVYSFGTRVGLTSPLACENCHWLRFMRGSSGVSSVTVITSPGCSGRGCR